MTTVTIQLTAEARSVLNRFYRWPQAIKVAVKGVMDRENEATVSLIKRDYLSQRGPTTLGVVTNRLRNSIRKTPARISGEGMVLSAIGTNVRYMGVHEFGFNGSVTVKEHSRKNPDRYRVHEIQGRTFSLAELKRAGLIEKGKRLRAKLGETVKREASVVRAHERKVNFPARAPLRTAIRSRLPVYQRELSRAIVLAAIK